MNDKTVATVGGTPITPPQLLAVAVEKGANIEQLEKLMDLQERWEANEAKKAYTAAMSEFKLQCPAITKSATVPVTKTGVTASYAPLHEITATINPICQRLGLSYRWRTEQPGDGLVKVTCVVTHVAGHSEEATLASGLDTTGSKNPIQSVGSTVSYLQRYTLFSIFGLASEEADTDGNMDTPPDAIDKLNACTTVEELQSTFKELWRQYPKARKELTGAKDIRKRELSND